MAVVENLSQSRFFSGLSDEARQAIAPYVHQRTVAPGQVVVWEGERCEAVYFVARGLVRTRRLSPEGREQVLSYLGPGESINMVPALDGGANPVTVDAVTDTTLYSIPCADCHRILREHHELALAVLEYLAAEVRRLNDMVEALALHTVRTRLARLLLKYASPAKPGSQDTTKAWPQQWTQQEIAAHIGTVREMVGRTLRAFADEGVIRRERGRIVVIDRKALEREARGE